MGKLLTVSRFWGPVITVCFTVLYHLTAGYFGFTVTYGWLWLALIVGVFIGGLRAGLLCGAWVTLYAVVTVPFEADPSRVIQIGLISMIGAWLIGYLRHREWNLQRAMTIAFANGNVTKMRHALEVAREGISKHASESDTEILSRFVDIESDIGNTLAILDGYHVLRDEIERVNQWYANPENVKRLQEIQESERKK